MPLLILVVSKRCHPKTWFQKNRHSLQSPAKARSPRQMTPLDQNKVFLPLQSHETDQSLSQIGTVSSASLSRTTNVISQQHGKPESTSRSTSVTSRETSLSHAPINFADLLFVDIESSKTMQRKFTQYVTSPKRSVSRLVYRLFWLVADMGAGYALDFICAEHSYFPWTKLYYCYFCSIRIEYSCIIRLGVFCYRRSSWLTNEEIFVGKDGLFVSDCADLFYWVYRDRGSQP